MLQTQDKNDESNWKVARASGLVISSAHKISYSPLSLDPFNSWLHMAHFPIGKVALAGLKAFEMAGLTSAPRVGMRHFAFHNARRVNFIRLASSTPQPPPSAEPLKRTAIPTAPRLFGVPELPLIDESSGFAKIKQKAQDFTDHDKAVEERNFLIEKITTSYWKDAQDIHLHGGKMWEASTKLIIADKALYMPNFHGVDLNNQKVDTTNLLRGKTTLMVFMFARFGEPHAASFVAPFRKEFEAEKDVQYIEMNVQENALKAILLRAFVPSIRRKTPESHRSNYVLLYKNIERLRKPLGMYNQYIGYVFLVDNQCRIRWAAHGIATPQEVATMLAGTRMLRAKAETW